MMVRSDSQYRSNISNSWIPPLVNSKDRVDIAMLFTLRESRRTSDSALLRIRISLRSSVFAFSYDPTRRATPRQGKELRLDFG